MRTTTASQLRARVHTFHVASGQIVDIAMAVDKAIARFLVHPDFRGLLFLERGDSRHEIVAITLWADSGMENTEVEAELSRRRIAVTADAGVSTKVYNVLRFSPRDPIADVLLVPGRAS